MTRILVCEWLPQRELARLRDALETVYEPEIYADPDRLLDSVGDMSGLIVRNRTQVTAAVVAAAPQLEIIGRLGAGLDNIDTDAAGKAGVVVHPAAGVNAVSVAEYVVGAMIMLMRPVFCATRAMSLGEWPRHGHVFGNEVAGKTLGLVGLGSIGREVASRAEALGMRILATDPYLDETDPAWRLATAVSLGDLLARSDIVSIHTALTPETHHLVDARAIASMKPGAVLINTSRGAAVDQDAVAAALNSGRLGGAALDVFASEPLDHDAGAAFDGLENVLLTPHVSGNTEEAVMRVSRVVVDAVIAALT